MADFGTPTIMFEVILFSDTSVLASMNYSAVLRALNDTDSSLKEPMVLFLNLSIREYIPSE